MSTDYDNAKITLGIGILCWLIAALIVAFSKHASIELLWLIGIGFGCIIGGIVGMIKNKPS
jgi:hypothetical protein